MWCGGVGGVVGGGVVCVGGWGCVCGVVCVGVGGERV